MSLAAKALWIMERNSEQPLNLNELAEACGVSRSHLAHAFGSAAGIPAIAYLRSRRLSRAAETLAAGAPDILSVALDSGYGSHEAFTRAFRDQFGLTPEAVRQRGDTGALPLTEALELPKDGGQPTLRPRFQDVGQLLVVGLAAPHVYDNTVGIPGQWQQFMAVCDDIPDHAEDIPVGVGQVPDEDGEFRYLCGIEVKQLGYIPPGLEAMKIAPARYAVFEHNGHVSGLYDTYRRVWNEALPAAGLIAADAPIIERHNPTFNPATGEGGLTLWIPLAEPQPAGIRDDEAVARSRNRETLASYDRYARRYAEVTATMSADTRDLLRRLAQALPDRASVLEIGSGPGWDADYLESMGLTVRRTDATPGFVQLQRERGKTAELLDLIGDPLGGPYDGALMLYVLQHIDEPLLPAVLAKLRAALRVGGMLLLSFREGDGTLTEHGTVSGDYHSTLRRPEDFRAALETAGFASEWERSLTDDDGVWQIVRARAR